MRRHHQLSLTQRLSTVLTVFTPIPATYLCLFECVDHSRLEWRPIGLSSSRLLVLPTSLPFTEDKIFLSLDLYFPRLLLSTSQPVRLYKDGCHRHSYGHSAHMSCLSSEHYDHHPFTRRPLRFMACFADLCWRNDCLGPHYVLHLGLRKCQ